VTDAYLAFRNKIISNLNKKEVLYKIFGGAVICLISDSRETEDIDMFIEKSDENIQRFIEAIVDSGFCDYKTLSYLIYGNNGKDFNYYGTFQLVSTESEYDVFHIDLCFQLGQNNYNTVGEAEYDDNGLKIRIVPFKEIAIMKANVHSDFLCGPPRDKDIKDIKIIADYLHIDPSTGEACKENKRIRFMNIFKRTKK
jgi:hypothetical protein